MPREVYREFELYQDYPPGWWHACHQDYDGPEDGRYYVEKTKQAVINIIDDYWDDQPEPKKTEETPPMITLTPAYGRDYKSSQSVIKDYLAGKDFILNDITSPWNGKPCSCRDFPNQQVKIRYHNLQRITIVESKE